MKTLTIPMDSNEINALLTRALLQKLGHRPQVVASGNAALDSFQAANSAGLPFDLILMDCQMPELDGYETTRLIRAGERSSNRHIPIIAITANALEEDRGACQVAGMDDFLAKPYTQSELRAMLDKWAP